MGPPLLANLSLIGFLSNEDSFWAVSLTLEKGVGEEGPAELQLQPAPCTRVPMRPPFGGCLCPGVWRLASLT